MEKKTEKGIVMISAASEALKFRKQNPGSNNDKIMNHVAKFISKEKNEEAKYAMVAAASMALSLAEKNPRMGEREIIQKVMEEISFILSDINRDNKKK